MPSLGFGRSGVRGLLVSSALTMLSACTSIPQVPVLDSCVDRYSAFEHFAAQRGISLSDPRGVEGFPSLGTNRSLAGFDPGFLTPEQRSHWLERLQNAGVERRRLLSSMLRDSAASRPLPDWFADLDLNRCDTQNQIASADPVPDWEALREAVQVEDDYVTGRRALGLYPVSSIFAGLGIEQLQDRIHQSFALPLSEIPIQGRLHRYVPNAPVESAPTAAATLAAITRDSLGPRLDQQSGALLIGLFRQHAPTLEVDQVGAYDVPGRPSFDKDGYPGVAGESLAYAYRYASLMPFAGELRLQLNYVFWFDERPSQSAMDSLSGPLDGLVWRVTLDSAGEVLLYDSIHSCGCYHQFFLGPLLAARGENAMLREPPLIPQRAPSGDGPVLRISSASHYIQRVYAPAGDVVQEVVQRSYGLLNYSDLYSLESPGGSRSLFAANGLVPGTERGERFYLWPMGIRSPGAMRERGRQPTAFVGRRHFDDADLLDSFFQWVGR